VGKGHPSLYFIMDAEQKLTTARACLALDHPFYGYLSMQLGLTLQEGVGTMMTDGTAIYCDPEFATSQSVGSLVTVLCHEIEHVIRKHPWRIQGRDPQDFNIATDFTINNDLDNMGINDWPVGEDGKPMVVLDHQYDEQSAEKIYNQIHEEKDDDGGDGDEDNDFGIGGFSQGPDSNSSAEREARMKEVDARVVQAAIIAKQRGKLSAHHSRIVEEIVKPQVTWKDELHQFATDRVEEDYYWSRPNKGIFAATEGEIIIPSIDGEGIGELAVGFDLSGSISSAEMNVFWSEIVEIFHTTRPSILHVLGFDTRVSDHFKYNRGDNLDGLPAFTGGGGTDFVPVFDKINDTPLDVCACIMLTDMYGGFPSEIPSYPTLWASTSDVSEAPFGKVINIEV